MINGFAEQAPTAQEMNIVINHYSSLVKRKGALVTHVFLEVVIAKIT